MQNFKTLGKNVVNSEYYIPLQRPRAVHALCSDQFLLVPMGAEQSVACAQIQEGGLLSALGEIIFKTKYLHAQIDLD